MFKNKKINRFKNSYLKVYAVTDRIVHFFQSTVVRNFIVSAGIGIAAVLAAFSFVHYSYYNMLLSSETALIQTEAAVISGEFSNYSTLIEAEKAGTYNLLLQYSSINSVRIRVVDLNYKIAADSYSLETGKTIVNWRVIDVFQSKRSISGTNSLTGCIEAVVPINAASGEMLGVLVANMDYSEIMHFAEGVKNRTDTVEIVLIFLILALAVLLTNFNFRHYKKAFRTVEDIASGHINKRVEKKGYTELKEFAQHFNEIMDKSNELDESRQEFVSNVSHELKTPMTSIKVLADSLNMQESVPIELYQEFMQDIVMEIDRENKIIEDLLALVRMDKTASPLNLSSVNLNELLELVLKRLKPIAQKKNVEILFESFRPVVAEIDEVKFTQVISNLVENAIKYNIVDGWVHVSLNADYQYFYVRVEDSGIGIPAESQNKVFERFYRVDKARSRETGGTGLGLAIVKSIILMHHGTIKMHSEENIGTTFTLRIPLNYVE